MTLLRNMLSAAVAGLLLTTGAWAQGTYRPGQTFSAGGAATPTPAASQPRPQIDLPVYQPAVQRVQPQLQQQVPQRVQSTPMYNMYNSAQSDRRNSGVSKPVVSRSTGKSASNTGSETKETDDDRDESSAVGTDSEKTKKTVAKDEASEKTSESKSDDKPVKPASTDKLVFAERPTGKKQIALTYDDGPNPSFTPKLVEYLKANNVPATFYLCGEMVKEYPDVVKMLAAEGFELANHSYDHPNLRSLSREKVVEQLQDTHDLIKEQTGIDVKTMRPPYGAYNDTVEDVCKAMGYKIILWDVDTEDWRKSSADKMMNTISKLTSDGSIILMHDRKHGGKETVLETTRRTVEKYRAKGYTFVTVTEIIGLGDSAEAVTGSTTEGPAINSAGTTSTAVVAGGALPAAPVTTPTPILP